MKTSIDKNLDSLVETFEKAGVKLTESQKAEIRKSVRELSPTEAARDAKYRAIFETIQHNMDVHNKLTAKLQETEFAKKERRYQELIESMKQSFEENKRLIIKNERSNADRRLKEALEVEKQKTAKAVEKYLDEYLEKTVPTKQMVDYKRLHELEAIVESMKDAIAFTNKDVQKRVSSIRRDYEDKLHQAKQEVEETTKALTEATDKINADKAKSYIARRVKDLPALEARMLQEKLAGCRSIAEVRKNFSSMLNLVEDEIAGGAVEGTNADERVTTKLNNIDSKLNNVDTKLNTVDSNIDNLDSKIDDIVNKSLVDTSAGDNAEGGEAGAASGDAGANAENGPESEISDGNEDLGFDGGMGGAAPGGAPAGGGDAGSPDFNAMSDDEINAHEFGSEDEGVPAEGGEENGEQVAAEPAGNGEEGGGEAAPAAPAPAQQAPANQPAEEPVSEAVISSATMNRWISECM